MCQSFKNIYYFLVYSNVLIALAAVGQCALTYLILNYPINPFILVIEGATTMLLYNLSLYLSLPASPAASPYRRTQWVGRNMPMFWIVSGTAACVAAFALSQIHLMTIGYLGIIGAMSVAYAVPLVRIGGKRIGLRQLPGLKLFYIALIWSLSSVGLPVVEAFYAGISIDWGNANYLGLVKILFLLLCTLPFDIRDIEQDRHYKLKTLPTLLGKTRSIQLSYLLGAVHILVLLVAPYSFLIRSALIVATIGVMLLLRLVIFTQEKHYHHVYLLDLVLILQWLIVLVFTKIS